MHKTSPLLFLLLLTGCDQRLNQAHEAVKQQLNDPDSAEFRDERKMSDGTICGEVNAKNRMGGYVGFTPYAATDYDFVVIGEDQVKEYCDEKEIAVREEMRKEREELDSVSSKASTSLHRPSTP